MRTLYTVGVNVEELLPHMKAALATATYGSRDEDEWNEIFVMFYQSKGDSGAKRMSVFSFDDDFICATHSRVTTTVRGNSNGNDGLLPVDAYYSDNRAYMSAYDLSRLVKWLKTLPKGIVYFKWSFSDVTNPTFVVNFEPERSGKLFEPVLMEYHALTGWNDRFRVPFNQGRCAYKNAKNYSALRHYSMITVRPLVLRWIDEVFDGRGVDLVPYDKGNMLYIRSDFRTNVECAMCLPYTATCNSQKKKDDGEGANDS